MNLNITVKRGVQLALLAPVLLCTLSFTSLAQVVAATIHNEGIRPTRDMVQKLSRRHYARLDINDELSSRLLDEYIDSLDPARIFLLTSDIDSFEQYRLRLDDDIKQGNVETAYTVFNVFLTRARHRLNRELQQLEQTIAALNYDTTEYLHRDPAELGWATSEAELHDRWRKRIKNDLLGLTLSGKNNDEAKELLAKRLQNHLRRINELNSDDVYTRYMNAYASLYDPHHRPLFAAAQQKL